MKTGYGVGLAALGFAVVLFGLTLAVRAQQKSASNYQIDSASNYQIDMDGSRVYIKVDTATRFGHAHGVQGNLKSGKLTLGGAGEFVFDMASFTADTAEARKRVGLEQKKVSDTDARKVTEAMRGGGVLDVSQFPTAAFHMTSIAPLDKQAAGAPGRYQLDGRFTLHGTEQKVQIEAKVEKTATDGVLRMSGSFSIKQTDYGITPYSALGGLAKVADELVISADFVLKAAK